MSSTNPIPLRFTGDYSLEASVSLAASASFVDNLRTADGAQVLDLAFPLEEPWASSKYQALVARRGKKRASIRNKLVHRMVAVIERQAPYTPVLQRIV